MKLNVHRIDRDFLGVLRVSFEYRNLGIYETT
jgi:hypothetical protein